MGRLVGGQIDADEQRMELTSFILAERVELECPLDVSHGYCGWTSQGGVEPVQGTGRTTSESKSATMSGSLGSLSSSSEMNTLI